MQSSIDTLRLLSRATRFVLRTVRRSMRLRRLKKLGIHLVPPNFLFFPHLITPNSTVIDVGCSHEAEFSIAMIEHYGAKAIAVDPTLKHRSALAHLARRYPHRFQHLPFAISRHDTTATFYESNANDSGSILPDHINAVHDDHTSYTVKTVTPKSLLHYLGLDYAAILKLDIEGAEYELLQGIGPDDLAPFPQIFIEFHHHAVERYSHVDTRLLVNRVCGFGYRAYSFDDHNYLFVRAPM